MRHRMRLLGYCLMPNHFHVLLWPRVERNVLRANLGVCAEDWRWGSLGVPRTKDDADRPTLTP